MSLSLGEKLRHAREERGISISEVAEQTRISSIYLESIERNDYKGLPGGIFNKGFVKSYAKFIGVDEQEALGDYARIAAENEIATEHELKLYKPEVLTDDRSSASMLPTILFAGVILALMTGGILFVLNYVQNQESGTVNTGNTTSNTPNSNNNPSTQSDPQPQGGAPAMGSVTIVFRADGDPIALTSVSDGKAASTTVATGGSVSFAPKESLKLSYSKSLAQSAKLTINGKQIELPQAPENPRRNAIELLINENNIGKIWTEGRITFEDPSLPAENANVNAAETAVTPIPVPSRPPATPAPRPSVTASAPAKTPASASNTGGGSSNAAARPSPN